MCKLLGSQNYTNQQMSYFALIFKMKLEEKPNMQVKVDRVNRLGKDVCEILDGPSEKAVKGELQEFNDRWQETAAALESYNDKGYPESGGDCCFMRIIKRKFKSFS